MEFNEKLQKLRKQKGLTQEELASALYVSRTAVSKWESSRGYPNLDSLKAMAKLFSVTVDELISSDELLSLAEASDKQTKTSARTLTFGLLDTSVATLFFLPLFRQTVGTTMQSTALISLSKIAQYLHVTFICVVVVIAIWGILTLALQGLNKNFWTQSSFKVSLILNAIGAGLFIISMQPYAATLLFVFLIIKILMLIKNR